MSNLIQIDVERIGDAVTSLHDLWQLPLQVVVAFVLLYEQVSIAFLAGVAIIIIMLPINTIIAKRIGVATKDLMSHKDARVQLISEV